MVVFDGSDEVYLEHPHLIEIAGDSDHPCIFACAVEHVIRIDPPGLRRMRSEMATSISVDRLCSDPAQS